MVNVLSMYLTRTQSYIPLKSENWMCVEDPFSQIRSKLSFKPLIMIMPATSSTDLKSHDPYCKQRKCKRKRFKVFVDFCE